MARRLPVVQEAILSMCSDARARKMMIIVRGKPRFAKVVTYLRKNGSIDLIDACGCRDKSDPILCVYKSFTRALATLLARYPNLIRRPYISIGDLCDEMDRERPS